MKKNRFIKLLVLFILSNVFLLGCENPRIENTRGLSHHFLQNDLVNITIVEDSLSDTSVELNLKNNTDKTVSFLLIYEILKQFDDDWYILKPNEDMYAMLLGEPIESNESTFYKINWEYYFGKLSPGNYQIVIKFDTGKDEFYSGVEFSII